MDRGMTRNRLDRAALLGLAGLVGLLAGASPATAQQPAPSPPDDGSVYATGNIVGRVVDATTGEPVAGAQVAVVGTERSILTAVDGRFLLLRVPAGSISLRVQYIGYSEKTVENVRVPEGSTATQNVALTSTAIALEAITVSATRERGRVSAALNEQRSAVGVTSATTAEQIARSPDSDAGQAVQRVSGVTVRDGKYVFVRGLGERYTTTSLNGARVPSPEPEKKVVPLDLFPSNLLEAITTSKTFTVDQPGDFSGAQINLRTRSFPAQRMIQFSLSGGVNTEGTGQKVPGAGTTGREWLAMAAGARALPSELTRETDFTLLSQGALNRLIRALPRDWELDQATGMPNVSGSLSLGGEDQVLGRRIGYIGSLSYSRSQEVRKNEERARAVPVDASGTPAAYNPFKGESGQTSVLWGGLLNLSTYVKAGKIEFNNTFDRTADNEGHYDWGTLEEFQQVDSVRRTSLRYVERTVRSNQLRGEHVLGEANRVRWSLTSSGVSRDEPDRADLAYGYERAPNGDRLPLAWLGFIPEAAKRTSSKLDETAWAGDLDYAHTFGAERPISVKLGSAYRHTTRDTRSASYNLRAVGLDATARAASPEQLFYGSYTEGDNHQIVLEPNASGGAYHATDQVAAGFAMTELPLGDRLRLIGGVRVEQWHLQMEVEPTSRALMQIERTNTDVLPSLALNARLSDQQTLRLSATQTLARPEYRELAPVSYRDMLGEREVFGDSTLVRTLVQNYDLRWESYSGLHDVLSIGLFAKHFDKPIEAIDVATSGASQLSFINAESAFNYGAEVEVRRSLATLAAGLSGFDVFANVTLMHSRINTSNSELSALTNDQRPMVGQAPYVVNTGLSYADEAGRTTATLLYNVVGKRIVSAAVTPITVDTYERPRQVLDFSVRFPLGESVTAKFDAKNLLDSAYEERQGDVIRYRYTSGRVMSVGLSWNLR